jgi:hypothetical protein
MRSGISHKKAMGRRARPKRMMFPGSGAFGCGIKSLVNLYQVIKIAKV